MIRAAIISLFALALPAAALELTLPGGATLALSENESATSYSLPVSPWLGTGTEMLVVEGALSRSVWQVADYSGNATQLMASLRLQLEAAGYAAVFACDATLCGGFDFRFAMDVTPEPAMHVDLGDFSYLVARAEFGEDSDYIALITSRGGSRGFVHMVRISPADMAPVDVAVSTRSPDGDQIVDLHENLDTIGTATLSDLQFATGSSTLSDREYPSLISLAAYLAEHPEARVVLVGHTDAEGSLAGNIALSQARAAAVLDYLSDQLAVARDQMAAEGVGYLAPRADNASIEGRQQNRRVEVVITSIQ